MTAIEDGSKAVLRACGLVMGRRPEARMEYM
jgi:hypothetical protein